jgi:hypothetical protein
MSTIKQQPMIRWQSTTTQRHEVIPSPLTQPDQLWEQLTQGQQQVVYRTVVLACLTLIDIPTPDKEGMSHDQQ